jgi:cytochrome c oxidase subunit II
MNFLYLANSFMPAKASTNAGMVDNLYLFLLISSFIGCVLSIGGMIYFVYKFSRKSENDKTAYITHNHKLEFLWSFVPFVVFMAAFFWGYAVYGSLRKAPKDATEIHVTGRQWSWVFSYKDGFETTNTLVVPKGKPIKLLMTSGDVIHSFFVPAFRNKMDVLPGKYTSYWFETTQEGKYDIFCTEYCGFSHSGMIGIIEVKNEADYAVWHQEMVEKAKAANTKDPIEMAKIGQELFNGRCSVCHSIDGSPKVGPSLKAVFETKREFVDGSSASADETYLRESILLSNAKVVKGFGPVSSMPVFQGTIKDSEVNALIEYIKSLK